MVFFLFLLEEGSVSESVSLTNGSGSRRPQNIRIRIRNTGCLQQSDLFWKMRWMRSSFEDET
jgi:hypothetical protein